jgi:hypothetical protein
MTVEVERATCDAKVGVRTDAEWPDAPIWCSASVALTTWVDINGRTHRACRHHLAAMLRRNPERYLSEIADDPLGQAKAARDYERTYEHSGIDPLGIYGPVSCGKAGHIDGCPGLAGGDHELRPGWISFEEDGHVIEIEVAP